MRTYQFVVARAIEVIRAGNLPIFFRERPHCAVNQFSLFTAYQLFIWQILRPKGVFAHFINGNGIQPLFSSANFVRDFAQSLLANF